MTDSIIKFQGKNIQLAQEQYDTFVNSISTQNPTPEEIQLHLWYCDSKNVNPLDKLIYFTKRQNRYTPITSIDFMRIRAESSGAYAGSDDAEFLYNKEDKDGSKVFSAKITVYKIVSGQRCSFSATARWSEYAPADIKASSAFMWKKMPHTMLAKCAEALALRKAFPGQLHGLYASEEMAQDGRYINEVVLDASVGVEQLKQIADEAREEAGNVGNDNQDNKPPMSEVQRVSGQQELEDVDKAFPPDGATAQAEALASDGEQAYTFKQFIKEYQVVKDIAKVTGKKDSEIVAFAKTFGEKFTISQLIGGLTPVETVEQTGEQNVTG